MTYRDLIEQYKNGELEGSKKERVERDIERQEAISDYLYENEQIPSIDEILGEKSSDDKDSTEKKESIPEKREAQKKAAEKESARMIKTIKRAVRRTLIKTAVSTGIVVLVIILAFTFIIPGAMNKFYYDPIADEFDKSIYVYKDMFLMEAEYNNFEITPAGYGNYYIKADEQYYDHFTGNGLSSKTVTGTIEKGTLLMNNGNIFSRSTDHIIRPDLAGVSVLTRYCDAPTAEYTDDDVLDDIKQKTLGDLVPGVAYEASITFDRPYKLTEFAKLTREGKLGPQHTAYSQAFYPVICRKSKDADLGSEFEASDLIVFNSEKNYYEPWDDDNEITSDYPFLDEEMTALDSFVHNGAYQDCPTFWHNRDEEDITEHAYATTKHIASSLRYLADHEDFRKMMGTHIFNNDSIENPNSVYESEAKYYRDFAKGIEKSGVYVYALVIKNAEAQQLQTLAENSHVKFISVSSNTTPTYHP